MEMSSTRGQKPKFHDGEKVLCFEPDPTKAKVLYDSKILEIIETKDSRGRKVVEYLVHFQGWNNSWDRCVPEEYVVKETEENRDLQKELAEKTAEILKKTQRRRKTIQEKVDETLKKIRNEDGDSRSSFSDESSSESDSDDDTDHVLVDEAGPLDVHLPKELKQVMEEDYIRITRDNKLKLPCGPNIIEILECYAKNFGMNLVCSPDRKSKAALTDVPPVEKSLKICREIVDGLRIYFDFMLPLILLYKLERPQYEMMSETLTTQLHVKLEPQCFPGITADFARAKPAPRLRSGGRFLPNAPSRAKTAPMKRRGRGRPRKDVKEEPEKVASLSPLPVVKEETQDTDSELEHPISSRLRHHSATDRKLPSLHVADKPSSPPSCASSHSSPDSKRQMRSVAVAPPQRAAPLTDKVASAVIAAPSPATATMTKPVSPFSSSSYASSTCSDYTLPHDGQSNGHVSHHPRKGDVLSDVLSWKLLPEDVANSKPTMPSLLYGAHHLLRLFVKLPELLGKIRMSQKKREAICTHLEMFLNYLVDKQAELFSESAYEDAYVQ
ncbi:PREDICTED: male-specific lethal 3 homolog isoform X2 [Priapulus caudatus]|uniref:Male-specific lethal 3 homolog isoform X2 n=1 Tax=Priapulus caudatus TaxID=37621 RepID=A0ABM1EXI8_PRICU|nr:PREDICTED: male-specific lethal 3 homolog isoform X2 [Priapulus caudatus]